MGNDSLDDVGEGGLQGGTADQESVNIGLAKQLSTVLRSDGSTIDDSGLLGDLRGHGRG